MEIATPPAMSPQAERLGRYRIVRKLQAGGMAEVLLAVDEGDPESRQVVIKRMLPHLVSSERHRLMFESEARICSRLNHPNIPRLYAAQLLDDDPYLVMEFVDGEDLGSLCMDAAGRVHPMPFEVVLPAMIAVLRALAYVHALCDHGVPLGIVHRDVTPANIMVTDSGATRLLDFGVSKSALNRVATSANVVKGKFHHMAPEQVEAQPVDGRADIFAAASTLYLLTTGVYPFDGAEVLDVLRAIRDSHPIAPERHVVGYPGALSEILMLALEKDRARRFASAAVFADALERFASGAGIDQSPARVAAALRVWRRGKRMLDAAPTARQRRRTLRIAPPFEEDAPAEAPTAPARPPSDEAPTAPDRAPRPLPPELKKVPPGSLNHLAVAAARRGDLHRAEEYLLAAIQLDPDTLVFQRNLDDVRKALARAQKAS